MNDIHTAALPTITIPVRGAGWGIVADIMTAAGWELNELRIAARTITFGSPRQPHMVSVGFDFDGTISTATLSRYSDTVDRAYAHKGHDVPAVLELWAHTTDSDDFYRSPAAERV
jgi:hypothetical protein